MLHVSLEREFIDEGKIAWIMYLVSACNPQPGAKNSLKARNDAFCRYQKFPYFLHVLCRSGGSLGKECWPPVIQKGGSKRAQGGSAMDLGAAQSLEQWS